MLYNSTKTSAGTVMPLLMGCTMQSRIQECQDSQMSYYDPASQMTYDTRVVGTYSLRTEMTKYNATNVKADQKNTIDDKKNV